MPALGAVKVHHGQMAGLRMWPIGGFENWLVFYRPVEGGIAIERVIHAKQDRGRLTGE